MDIDNTFVGDIGWANVAAVLVIAVVGLGAVAWAMSAPAAASAEIDQFEIADADTIAVEEGTGLQSIHVDAGGTVTYEHVDSDAEIQAVLYVGGEEVDRDTHDVTAGSGSVGVDLSGDVIEETSLESGDFAPGADETLEQELDAELYVEMSEPGADGSVLASESATTDFFVTVEGEPGPDPSVTVSVTGEVTVVADEPAEE